MKFKDMPEDFQNSILYVLREVLSREDVLSNLDSASHQKKMFKVYAKNILSAFEELLNEY